MNFHLVLPRLLSAIMSLLQATDLRNRMYAQAERIEILETALTDIGRINSSKDPRAQELIHNIVQNTVK